MKSNILQCSVNKQGKRIYEVEEKVYQTILNTERKNNEMLTIVVAENNASEIFYFFLYFLVLITRH